MLSVLLCTHRPRPDALRQTLDALRAQTHPRVDWELLLIDNASRPAIDPEMVAWHPRGRIVREGRLGLTFARARGIVEARGDLLVFCDDDNLLAPDYLAQARDLFTAQPTLGAAGGKIVPHFAVPLPDWFRPFVDCLAVRDFGSDTQLASWKNLGVGHRIYPPCAPVGAGMILRRCIGLEYASRLKNHGILTTDRMGKNLASGGDNDMVLTALRGGWSVGYFPQLALDHLIPADRLRLRYLAQLNRGGNESWVRLLGQHGLSPWGPIPSWTVGLRQARAFFAQGAWRGPASYFKWAGACGLFEGRAKLPKQASAGK